MLDRLAPLVARLPEPVRARIRGAVRGAPSLAEVAPDSNATADTAEAPEDARLTEQDIWTAYRLFMGRTPDDAGLEFFRARIGDWSPADLLPYFAHSDEFRSSSTYRVLLGGSGSAGHEIVEHRGHRVVVPVGDDAIGAVLRTSGTYEPHVMACLEQIVNPGATFVDGGANIGIISMAAAELVGPEGRVVSVEALAANAALVRLSAAVNGFDHVTVHHGALDAEPGLRIIDTAAGSNGIVAGTVSELLGRGLTADQLAAREVVEATTLDALTAGLEHVDVLKLDIEGAEGLALAGGRELLDRARPTIVLEYSPDLLGRVSSVAGPDLLAELVDRGYELRALDEGQAADPLGAAVEPTGLADRLGATGHDHVDLLLLPRR